MYPFAKRLSRFKSHFHRKQNLSTNIITNRKTPLSVPEDPAINLEPSDFSSSDSNVMVRERTRGSKFDAAYRKRHGKLVDEIHHTVSFLPAGCTVPILLSKREIGRPPSSTLPPATPLTDELFAESGCLAELNNIADFYRPPAKQYKAAVKSTSATQKDARKKTQTYVNSTVRPLI